VKSGDNGLTCGSIVFRAFQGIGGGGSFSLCTIIIIDLVPPEKYAQMVAHISITNALALLVGPIVGGAIAANTTWRWIFIIKYVKLLSSTKTQAPDSRLIPSMTVFQLPPQPSL
jgi:hypothetical protein